MGLTMDYCVALFISRRLHVFGKLHCTSTKQMQSTHKLTQQISSAFEQDQEVAQHHPVFHKAVERTLNSAYIPQTNQLPPLSTAQQQRHGLYLDSDTGLGKRFRTVFLLQRPLC